MARKKKAQPTEIFDGAGISAGLKLKVKLSKRAATTASGRPASGRASSRPESTYYKPEKHWWDGIGTFDTSLEAAVAAAIAQKSIEMGTKVGLPDKSRVRMKGQS